MYAQLDLFNDTPLEKPERIAYTYSGEELHKSCKKDFDPVAAIIEIFRGEVISI